MVKVSSPPTTATVVGHVGGVQLCVAVGDDPWELGEVLVVPCDEHGYPGSRGVQFDRALAARGGHAGTLPALIAGTAEHQLRPEEPRWIDLTGSATPSLGELAEPAMVTALILATAVDRSGPDGESSASAASAAQATRAVIRLAADRGATTLVTPLLGTGNNHLGVDEVLSATLAAIRAELADPRPESHLEALTLLMPDADTAAQLKETMSPSRVQLRMLADRAIDDDRHDLLDHGDYAGALANLIGNPETPTPLTIAINAPWGAGKTSVAKLTSRRLEAGSPPAIVCWFNAWQHDDAPTVATALAASVARTVAGQRSWWRRVMDPLPGRILTPSHQRRRWVFMSLVSIAVAIVALVVSGQMQGALKGGQFGWAALAGLGTGLLQTAAGVRGTANEVAGLVRAPGRTLASGSLEQVSTDLKKLIHQATRSGSPRIDNRRLVVFIDDVERCQPPRSIEVCEAVNQLLSHEDVVVVLIGDMQTIALSAASKYSELASRYASAGADGAQKDDGKATFGQLYLEKVVQFRFDLPAYDRQRLQRLVTALLASPLENGVLADARPQRLRWVRTTLGAPTRLWLQRRRWRMKAAEVSRAVDDLNVAERFADGAKLDAVAEQLSKEVPRGIDPHAVAQQALQRILEGPEFLERSYHAVAAHVRPLPRDGKRLVNRIRFNLWLARERGFLAPTGGVSVQQIGKWSLLADRWPDLAAAAGTDPDVLARCEAAAKQADTFTATMQPIVPAYAKNEELRSMLADEPHLDSIAAATLVRCAVDGDGSPVD